MKLVRSSDPLSLLPMAASTRAFLQDQGIRTAGELLDAPAEVLAQSGQARRLARQLGRGDRELGLLEWGVELPVRWGRLLWSLSEGLLTLWGSGAMTDFTREKCAPWAPWAREIREVRVEEAVENVGARAFAGCAALERVSLCESVRRIGAEAFRDCAALGAVETPRTMESWRMAEEGQLALGEGAFTGAAFRPDLPGGLRIRSGVLVEYRGEGGPVEIPEGVERIGTAAFENRPVTAVTLPRSLKHIGTCAFRGTALAELILPKGLETVGEWAFAEIPTLRRVVIRSRRLEAAEGAFTGTPVAGRARAGKKGWPKLLSMQLVQEPGMEPFRRLTVGEQPGASLGTSGFATRPAVRKLLKEGNMLLRIIPAQEENRVKYVDVIYIHPYYGLSRFRTEPCRSEEGYVEPWRDEETRYDSLKTEGFDLTGIRVPGRVQWYTVPYKRYAEFDTPLNLLECWLKSHPEYSIPTAQERFEGWWPGPKDAA